MRPLNRPMFRYGGPIKEGVMSGIREPKKNGGKMLLVGQHPKEFRDASGREKHVAPVVVAGAVGLNALRHGAMRYGARYLPRIWQGAKNLFGKNVAQNVGTTNVGGKVVQTIGSGSKFVPNWLGRDPLIQGLNWGRKAIFNPTVGGWAGKAARFVFSPSGLIAGAYFAHGKFFDKDGNEIKNPKEKGLTVGGRIGTSGAPGGGDPGMYLTPQGEAPPPGKSAEQIRKDRIQKYRDIMDIKGMNKEAAANSLIEASRLINESEDFKGDIKSGSLVNKIIQGASKAFDKPSKTKDAIDTLILKGEIEKDIKADDPAAKLAAKLTGKRIELADKQLAGDTFEEIISARMVKDQMPKNNELASLLRVKKGIDAKVIPSTNKPTDKDHLQWVTEIITNYNEDPKPGTYPEGVYIVSDRIISVDAQGNVTKIL